MKSIVRSFPVGDRPTRATFDCEQLEITADVILALSNMCHQAKELIGDRSMLPPAYPLPNSADPEQNA